MSKVNVLEFPSLTDEEFQKIQAAAHNIYLRYGGNIEYDDIVQAICLDVLEHPARYKGTEKQLTMRYRGAGLRYCEKERVDYLHFADQHVYSSDDVRLALASYYCNPDCLDEPDPALLDLKAVLFDLREKHYWALERRFTAPGPSTEYDRKLTGEAISILTAWMNRRRAADFPHEGPGARRAISNSRAVAAMES